MVHYAPKKTFNNKSIINHLGIKVITLEKKVLFSYSNLFIVIYNLILFWIQDLNLLNLSMRDIIKKHLLTSWEVIYKQYTFQV